MVRINKGRGKIRRALQHWHFKASLFRAIREMAIPIVVIKDKTFFGEARDKQIRLAIVVVITRNCRKAILTPGDR